MKETEQNNKKSIKSSRLKVILGVLLAGATLISGIINEGILVQEYSAKAEKGYCTVLVYMDGSDLESSYGAATEDLQEMEKALKTYGLAKEDVHIVVEAGGAANWEYDAMQNEEYGRFCVSAEGAYDVESMEARDMGAENTLTDFINYGTQSYPAEHYGLVFWNHGAGQIAGFGCDNQFDGSSLSLREIENAIENSAFDQAFSFISMDACLMGNIELAAVLEKKTEYLIVSEELEPQYGYDYAWIGAVKEEMEKASESIGRTVGETMLHTYEEFYRENDYKLTLTLIDLEAYRGFHDCFDQILDKALQNVDDTMYQQLGKKRKELQGFGDSGGGSSAEIVDLMDFMEIVTNLTDDTVTYEKLQKEYDRLVLDKVTKGYTEEPAGLSIYLPSGANEWLLENMSVYETIGFCDIYQSFLEGYQNFLAEEGEITWHSVDKKQQEIIIQVDTDMMDSIANAYLAVFCDVGREGMVYLLSTDSDVVFDRAGYLKAKAETQYWGLKDEVLCLIETVNTDGYTEYMAPVLYRDELCVIHIGFSEDDENGSITAITPVGTKKQQYELQDGDFLYPLYPLEYTEDSDNTALLIDEPGKNTVDGFTEPDAVKSGDIYKDSYYVGNKISIESTEDGDAELMLLDVELEQCMFGFLLQDTKQRLYYTDFVTE